MYGNIEFKIDPLKQADKLKTGMKNKVLRIAMNKGAAVVKNAVIGNAPVGSGALQKSIRIKIKHYKNKDLWVAIVGPKSSFKRGNRKPSRYAHLLEGGSKKMTARKFLTPAMSSTRDQYIETVTQKLAEQIEAILST